MTISRRNWGSEFLEILIVFFLQGRITWAGINLAGLVFACAELILSPLVVDVGLLCLVHNLFKQMGRHELDSLAITKDQISCHNGRIADWHRNIDAREHDITNG